MDHGSGRACVNNSRAPRAPALMQALSQTPKMNQMKINRLLISVIVSGSSGPLRFVVNADLPVMAVIDLTLKNYAHEGRLPVLGSDVSKFLLYPANGLSDALCPRDSIGLCGNRNFVLYKKQGLDLPSPDPATKSTSGWKSWLNQSLHRKAAISG